jgi:hypothetical protein
LQHRSRYNHFSAAAPNEPNLTDLLVGAVLSAAERPLLLRSQPVFEAARKKYRRSAMENTSRLQCKALYGQEKSRRRKNNGYQWKNNAKNNGKQ